MRIWRVARENGYGIAKRNQSVGKKESGAVLSVSNESCYVKRSMSCGVGCKKNQSVLRVMIVSSLMLYPTRMSRWTELVAEVITVRVNMVIAI